MRIPVAEPPQPTEHAQIVRIPFLATTIEAWLHASWNPQNFQAWPRIGPNTNYKCLERGFAFNYGNCVQTCI